MVNPDRIERLVAEGHLDSAAALCEAESEKSHLDEVWGVGCMSLHGVTKGC